MRDINDLEHFVLQPGEMLILRSKRYLSMEEMQFWADKLKHHKIEPVLILPPDMDVMAGTMEVISASTVEAPELSQEEIDSMRTQVKGAYEDGRIVEYREAGNPRAEWIGAHLHASPHLFNFNKYEYRIPSRR